jgi:hypothetical protein
MNLKAVDWIALLSFIASGGLATLAQVLSQIYPGQATAILNVLAIVTALAGVLIRLFANKTGAPTTAIVANPIVVANGTTVVHADTPAVATNVTTPVTEKGTP